MQQLEKRTNTEGLVRFLQGSRESRRIREERKSRTRAALRVSSASRYHLGEAGGGGGRREGEGERGRDAGKSKGSVSGSSSRGEQPLSSAGVSGHRMLLTVLWEKSRTMSRTTSFEVSRIHT